MDQLIALLKKIEKQDFRSYQQIKGKYDFKDFELSIDFVQSDSNASASRLRAFRPWSLTDLQWLCDQSKSYQIGARDFIARQFVEFAKHDNAISMSLTGQTVQDTASVLFTEQGIELRFRLNLPADGRHILGKKAINLLTFHLPKFIRRATIARELDLDALKKHSAIVEDQTYLRSQLSSRDLIAFVADGSLLARESGFSDRPLKDGIAFVAPESLAVELDTLHHGTLRGLGIKKGITLIVGGGFHGKSTLLHAVERGIYNHLAGDGREFVVTEPNAVKIRAEEGRSITNVNLSNFINNLPLGKSTDEFSTTNASGSTSQAAWVQESLEAGVSSFFIDEDTCATNFMIRDARMRALISAEQEPISPFVDKVGALRDDFGISTLLVMGGSSDYFPVADTVIQIKDYQAYDLTEQTKALLAQELTPPTTEVYDKSILLPSPRALNCKALLRLLTEGKYRITAKGNKQLKIGKEIIELSAIEQLESATQINAIGWVIFNLAQTDQWLKDPMAAIEEVLEGDWLAKLPANGDLSKPRVIDVMAALNRLDKVDFKQY